MFTSTVLRGDGIMNPESEAQYLYNATLAVAIDTDNSYQYRVQMFVDDGPIVQAEHTFQANAGAIHHHTFTPNPVWQEGHALIQLDRRQNDEWGERDTAEIEMIP